MDGLSVAASIIAVLQLTSEMIKYLNDVKNAPEECQQCTTEVSNLQSLLINLLYHLNQEKTGHAWYTAVRALNVENGPLNQYKQALEQLRSRVEIQDGIQKIKGRLLWKFTKEEVASVVARMERLKSLVNIALELDHFKLSLAIKEDISFARDTLPSLQTHVVSIRDAQNRQWDSQKLQQHNTIMEWLSPIDFPAQQQDIITRRQEGTGQWFLDSSEFKLWLQGSNKTLFCPGIPGAGKTTMAAIAIDHLCRTSPGDDIGVACLFCNYKAKTDQSAASLLAALLKQLVQSRPDIKALVTHMYEDHSKRRNRPSLDEIFGALQSACSNYTTVYIIVDALDEYADRDIARSRLLAKLRELQASTDLRLLFTSRFITEITQEFQSNSILEVRANEEDVRQFVAGQMSRLPKYDEQLKHAIQDKIVEAVDGMFLLARLYVELLRDKRRKRDVLSTLNQLPKGSVALDNAYNKAIKQIDEQLPGDRLLAKRAISWIVYSQRPLTTKELCYALSIEPDDKALASDDIYDVESVISVCAGLITVDEKSSIIRLVHYTTQEYFERVRIEWNPRAQEEIAVACLTYLSFDAFRSGSCVSKETFEQRLAENAFLNYSALYWSEHVRPVESITSCFALGFLYDEALVDCAIQAALPPGDDFIYDATRSYEFIADMKRFPSGASGLHLTARYGLLYLTEMLLMGKSRGSNIEADSKDGDGRTSLSWAADGGHEAVVRLLIKRDDVKADSKDKSSRTPLSYAAGQGHQAIVQLLIERNDVEADSKDEYIKTPLHYAAEGGHKVVVSLLIERDDVNIDLKNKFGQTPLSKAALWGHEAIVRLLIERDNVKADSKNKDGQTPLSYAARKGHKAIVQLLIKRNDVEADSKDKYNRTPLSYAANEGHSEVVRLLVKRDDVKADSKDKDGRTPLLWAAIGGHKAIVQLLIKRDNVKADLKDKDGRTPLSYAARQGHEAIVQLLIKRNDVEADLKDKCNRTPLSYAAAGSHEAVVRLLVERDNVEADSRDKDGRTPLSWAAEEDFWTMKEDREAVVRLLVKQDDVEADSKDTGGRTPLSYAAEQGHSEMVRLLVERDDVETNSKDKTGRTPLSWAAVSTGHTWLNFFAPWSAAAFGGNAAVVNLLLELGDVEADSKDNDGRTPLSWAAEKGHWEIVQLLLGRDDVEANSKDKDGRSPLSWAAQRDYKVMVRMLLERDDVSTNSKGKHGQASLPWTAEKALKPLSLWLGHEAVIRLLLERDDVEVNFKDSCGWTLLSRAAWEGHKTMVQVLMKMDDFNIDLKDMEGRTPLLLSAWRGHEAIVQMLIEQDAVEANSKDSYGRTPLSYAAEQGHQVIVQLLVERDDVEANSKDNYGRTPLFFAVIGGHEAVVRLLVERNDVEVDLRNNYGRTPLFYAVEGGHEAVVRLLVERKDVTRPTR